MSKEIEAARPDQSEIKKPGLPKGGIRRAWEVIADLTIAQMDLNERLDILERPPVDKLERPAAKESKKPGLFR